MAPPIRKSGLNKRSDSTPPSTSTTEESAETSCGTFQPPFTANRSSRLNTPFKSSEDSSILKRNARDLSSEVMTDEDLMFFSKTNKQDSEVLDLQLLPREKIGGGLRDHKRIALRAGVHRVKKDRLKLQTPSKLYDESDSTSKMTEIEIVSESNESLSLSVCSIIPKERQTVTKGNVRDFGEAIASTSKAYVSAGKGETVSKYAMNEFDSVTFSSDEGSLPRNIKEDYIITSSSSSDWKRRMNTIIIGKSRRLFKCTSFNYTAMPRFHNAFILD